MTEKRRSRAVEPRLRALNMRTTEALRSHLEAAALASGRTLCGEVEHRLEASFAEDRMRAIAREEAVRLQEERDAAIARSIKSAFIGANDAIKQTRLQNLAATAPERTTGYLREALKDPTVKAAVHQRYELGRSDVCDCGACSVNAFHASDCAVHREPAYPNGPCDCGISNPSTASQMPRGYNY